MPFSQIISTPSPIPDIAVAQYDFKLKPTIRTAPIIVNVINAPEV